MKRLDILALDPGERVGWSICHTQDGELLVDAYGILRMKQAGLALEDTESKLYVPSFDVVIFETWVLTSHGARVSIGSDMPSSQFVGMIRLACWRARPKPKLVPQPPKDMSTARFVLNDPRADYAAIAAIIDAAPAAHDDSHYTSALLHTVKFFHKEIR